MLILALRLSDFQTMAGFAYGRGGAQQDEAQPWPHFKQPREVLRELWPNLPLAADAAAHNADAAAVSMKAAVESGQSGPQAIPTAVAGGAVDHCSRAIESTPGMARGGVSCDASCGAQASDSHAASVQVHLPSASQLDVQLVDAREAQRQKERFALMHGGALLFKYQRGEGAFSFASRKEKRREERLLKLSADSRELRWARAGAGGGQSKLQLAEVCSLVHGHDTELFRQMLIVPDAAELCFSLVTPRRTFSFAARTPSQAETWVVGLSALCGLPMRRRGAFLWSELRLRTRAEAEGSGLAALLPHIARELDESREVNADRRQLRVA